MAETFRLPASSYDELVKIIKAYATGKNGQALSLDELAQSSGMLNTTISKNNGFLIELELITPGKSKTPTEACSKLGRAYSHKMDIDAVTFWRTIIENNDFLNRMISAIKIRGGMDRTNFVNHIIYSSGQNASKEAKAGAGALIEIFKFAGFVIEQDGKITALKLEPPIQNDDAIIAKDNVPSTQLENNIMATSSSINKSSAAYQITLNINLNGDINDLEGLASKINKFVSELSKE